MLVFVDRVCLKNEVEAPPRRHKHQRQSHRRAYNHRRVFIDNEMTTPKSLHDETTPTEKLAGFIISDFLKIVMFANVSTFTVIFVILSL